MVLILITLLGLYFYVTLLVFPKRTDNGKYHKYSIDPWMAWTDALLLTDRIILHL